MLSSRWSTRTKHASYRWTGFPALAWQASWREEGSDIYPVTSKYKSGHILDCTSLLPWNTFTKDTFLLYYFFNDRLSWWIVFGFFLQQRRRNQKIKSNEWIYPPIHQSIYESVNHLNKQWKERNKKVREGRVEKGVLSCLHEIWLRQVSSLPSQMLRLSLTELFR